MDILEHLGMLVPDIEGHGVITGRANGGSLVCSVVGGIMPLNIDN